MPDSVQPDTIVLIHGLWMTPRSWEHWIAHYEGRGLKVLAPAYPGFEVEVEALRADPAPIERATVDSIAHHFETVIRGLPKPPIIIGHSFGGAITQIMLDRTLGHAGVAINSVMMKGVLELPLSTVGSLLPALANPANRHKSVPFTREQFHHNFANTISEEESNTVYDRYHIPAPGGVIWAGALQNFNPHAPTTVDYSKPDRAPLLFISSSEDRLMPPTVNKSNYRHYNSGIVAYREYGGRSHYPTQTGWEEVADYALEWALNPHE
jgi:pimeloyl-ACP methyl ester carboxylesterase